MILRRETLVQYNWDDLPDSPTKDQVIQLAETAKNTPEKLWASTRATMREQLGRMKKNRASLASLRAACGISEDGVYWSPSRGKDELAAFIKSGDETLGVSLGILNGLFDSIDSEDDADKE